MELQECCSVLLCRAFSLIHTDLVNSDVKTAAGQHIILFVFSEENVYFFGDVLKQMEM